MKKRPYHAKMAAEEIFKIAPHDLIKIVVVLDNDVDIHDNSTSIWKVFNNVDPKRDFYFFNGGLAIDATRKWMEEGYMREWPPEIRI